MFAAFTRAVHDVGAFGNGSRMKYVANLLVAIHNVASAEAMVLGMKAGLPPQLIFDLIKIGAGNSRVFELRAPMMVKDRYDEPDHEDFGLAEGHGRHRHLRPADRRADAAVLAATLPIYAAAMSTGHAADDTAAVCAVLESHGGGEATEQGAREKTLIAFPPCAGLVPDIHVFNLEAA